MTETMFHQSFFCCTQFQMQPSFNSWSFLLVFQGLCISLFIHWYHEHFSFQTFVIRWVVEVGKRCRHVFKKRSKKMYELIEAEMAGQANWPPTSSADLSLSELMKMENMASHSASANAHEGNNELDVDSASDTESADLGLRSSRRRLHSARSNSVDHVDDSVVLLHANWSTSRTIFTIGANGTALLGNFCRCNKLVKNTNIYMVSYLYTGSPLSNHTALVAVHWGLVCSVSWEKYKPTRSVLQYECWTVETPCWPSYILQTRMQTRHQCTMLPKRSA